MTDRRSTKLDPTRCWLLESARRHPRATALSAGGVDVDFETLAAGARDCAARLVAADVGRGDRVALLLGSSRRFVELVHALQMLGAVVVPLNDRLALPELEALLRHCRPKLLVHDGPRGGRARSLAACDGIGVAVIDAGAELDALAPTAKIPERIDADQLHSIVYTSGTTGRPKGVMLSNANHLAAATGAISRLGLSQTDRWLAPMPLYHVGGMSILLRSAVVGLSVLLQDRFDARAVWSAIERERATIVSLVPTMLMRVLETVRELYPSEGTFSVPRSLRVVLVGGASLPPELAAAARGIGLPVLATYGLTEAASQVATAAADDVAASPHSCGRPIDGVEVRIDAPGERGYGEIHICGAVVTRGYFDDPEATKAARRGLWWATGDLGRVDDAGRLEVGGRRADLIVSGGENVAPAEVEAVIEAHPAVACAGVYGEEDARWGQRVVARVVLRPGQVATASDLEAWCRQRLAGFKAPRRFDFCDALPRTASGKLARARLGQAHSSR